MADFGSAAFARTQTIEIMLEAKAEHAAAFTEVNRNLDRVVAAVLTVAKATEQMRDQAEKASRSLEEEAGALKEVRTAAVEAAAATGFFAAANRTTGGIIGGIWAALTQPRGWAQFLVTALVVLAGPLLMIGGLIAASTAVMVAWAVGATAMIALLGGLALGFAAVGGAIMGLGIASMNQNRPTAAQLAGAQSGAGVSSTRIFDAQQAVKDQQAVIAQQGHGGTPGQLRTLEDANLRLARAQDANNAALGKNAGIIAASQTNLQDFINAWNRLKNAVELASVPIAQMGLDFARKLFKPMQADAQLVIHWFSARMPGALLAIGKVIKDLLPPFSHFVGFLGRMFDKWAPSMGPLLEQGIKIALPIIERLIISLDKLTTWFLDRLPTYGPIVSAIFDWMGRAISTVFGIWGNFADWGARTFKPLLDGILAQWNKPGVGSGFIAQMKVDLPIIADNVDKWIKASPTWLPALLNVAEGIVQLVTWISQFLSTLGAVFNWIQSFVNNDGFWHGLQDRILDIGRSIGNILDQINIMTGGIGNAQYKNQGAFASYADSFRNLHPDLFPKKDTGPVLSDRASTASRYPPAPPPPNIVINVYQTGDPAVVARIVAQKLRTITQS